MASKSYTLALTQKLIHEEVVEKIENQIAALGNDNNRIILFVENQLKKYNLLPDYNQFKLKKCREKADEFCKMGNQAYKDQNFYEALVNYNKSLCFSTKGSQRVGIAFANKSAIYLKMEQYEKCLENIELAKNHNYPNEKIDKLNKRGKEALEKLKSSPGPNQKMIKYEEARERFMTPKLKAKENLNFFVADCLEVKNSPEFGRYLITNQDLSVGSVIGVEKPFSKILEPDVIYERCATCLGRNLLNLIPCYNCCSAMFCSENCRIVAHEKFHKFECGLVNAIDQLFAVSLRIALRTYFEALNICGSPSKLKEFLDSIKNSNATILDFEHTDDEDFFRNSLHSVDALVPVETIQNLNIGKFYNRCTDIAILCNLMLNHSTVLRSTLVKDVDKIFFREFILRYFQKATLNFHGLYCKKLNSCYAAEIGIGSFPFCSLINHSCASNVFRVSFETSIHIVVHRPIKKGEQIFDDYGYSYSDKFLRERQNGLMQAYHFKCACEACENNYQIGSEVKDKILHRFLQKRLSDSLAENFDVAVENFEKYCKYVDKLNETDFPSQEICTLQFLIVECLRIFTKTECYEV